MKNYKLLCEVKQSPIKQTKKPTKNGEKYHEHN